MTKPIEKRIRWSGILIVLGLAVLLLSLLWSTPLSFMGFLALGCPLVVAGVLLYLWSLAGRDSSRLSGTALLALCVFSSLLAGCGGGIEKVSDAGSSADSSVFDPATATARVFGKLTLDGKPPETAPLKIGRDPYCQKNGQAIFKQGALLKEDGTVRNVIVYVRSGYEGRSYPVPAEPVVLDQQQCVYIPHVLTIMKGQKLRILNSDPTFHNVHAKTADYAAFNIGQASKGVEDIQTFSKTAMPYRIGCDFHDWMIAYAGVFDHPFHTTSGDRGTYELRLPPGKYEIVAWHEKFREMVAFINVLANDSLELNFEFSQKSAK